MEFAAMKWIASMVLLAALNGAAASSGTPVAVSAPASQLMPGEILLQINAVGTTQSPAERGAISFRLLSRGRTEADAVKAQQATLAALRSDIAAAGLQPDALKDGLGNGPFGFVGNEAFEMFQQNASGSTDKMVATFQTLTISNLALVEPAKAVLRKNNIPHGDVLLSLRDDSAAKRRAIGDAVARAKAQAIDYATPLGMRVARVLRVTDQPTDPAGMQTIMRLTSPLMPSTADPGKVMTAAQVGIDFALLPN